MVVIVGRPNVGKSSLLNLLARQRISIVDPRAGITRDRVSALLEHRERWLELVDTGGIGMVDDHQLEEHVARQIEFAIQRADLVLFVVDVQNGITPLDQIVAQKLRAARAPVILVANKTDHVGHESLAGELIRLGFGEAICVSALHSAGRARLLDAALETLRGASAEPPDEPLMKLAIVGKRNAGKSTLVNALAGEQRMIVSEIPGTTRDAVDVLFERDGRKFMAIDTAGVRKKRSMDDIDFYSFVRAERAIRRADVVLLLIDAMVPLAEVDLKLASLIESEYKPCLLVVNKWDLARDKTSTEEFGEYLTRAVPLMRYAPIAFITARTGQNADAAVDAASNLHRQAQLRVPTAQLNKALEAVLAERGPSAKRGARPVKIYYATQVDVAPPSFVFSCNRAELVTENYRRYLENRLRDLLPTAEVPMRLMFRSHHKADSIDPTRAAPNPTHAAPNSTRDAPKSPRAAAKQARPTGKNTRSAPKKSRPTPKQSGNARRRRTRKS